MKKRWWVTKYALSQGLFTTMGEVVQETYVSTDGGLFLRIGRDAFLKEADAVANAIDRAERRRVSLEKESVKLKKCIADWDRLANPKSGGG